MKKYFKIIISIIIIFYTINVISFAHRGRTDSNGGHYDRSTGEYHYHHGYGPHQHPNGICPYKNNTNYLNDIDNSTTSVNNVLQYNFNEVYNGKITAINTNTSNNTSNVSLLSTQRFSFIKDHWFILFIIIYLSICTIYEFIESIKEKLKKKSKNNKSILLCPNCGKQIDNDWDFCNNCGNKLK